MVKCILVLLSACKRASGKDILLFTEGERKKDGDRIDGDKIDGERERWVG